MSFRETVTRNQIYSKSTLLTQPFDTGKQTISEMPIFAQEIRMILEQPTYPKSILRTVPPHTGARKTADDDNLVLHSRRQIPVPAGHIEGTLPRAALRGEPAAQR